MTDEIFPPEDALASTQQASDLLSFAPASTDRGGRALPGLRHRPQGPL